MTWTAKIIAPFAGHEDWLEWRRHRIGASDIAAITGISPWRSPYQVWASKFHGVEQDDRESFRWGRKLESIVLDEFEAQTGLHVYDRQMVVVHHEHEWASATLDGVAYESGLAAYETGEDRLAALGVVEAKTTHESRWGEDGYPDHYVGQVQWQMFVTGLEMGWLAVLHQGREFRIYEIPRDDKLIDLLAEIGADFYEKHMKTGEPPEVDGSEGTARVLADLWEPTERREELTGEAAAAVKQLPALRAELKRMQKEEQRLVNVIKASLQDAEVGVVDGVPVVSWKLTRRQGYTVEPKEFRTFRLLKGAKDA